SGWTIKNLKTMKENRMLWLSIVVGIFLVFPVIYIPGFNTTVFKHYSLTYEWGLVVIDVILFILFAELYKMIKRRTMKPLYLEAGAMEMRSMPTGVTLADSVMGVSKK
ncbi:Na+ ATPase, partial [Podila verticillata]